MILTGIKTRTVCFFLIMALTKLRCYFVTIFQILVQLLRDIRAIHLQCFFSTCLLFVYFLSSGKSIRLCFSLTLKSVCILYNWVCSFIQILSIRLSTVAASVRKPPVEGFSHPSTYLSWSLDVRISEEQWQKGNRGLSKRRFLSVYAVWIRLSRFEWKWKFSFIQYFLLVFAAPCGLVLAY